MKVRKDCWLMDDTEVEDLVGWGRYEWLSWLSGLQYVSWVCNHNLIMLRMGFGN